MIYGLCNTCFLGVIGILNAIMKSKIEQYQIKLIKYSNFYLVLKSLYLFATLLKSQISNLNKSKSNFTRTQSFLHIRRPISRQQTAKISDRNLNYFPLFCKFEISINYKIRNCTEYNHDQKWTFPLNTNTKDTPFAIIVLFCIWI